MCPIEYAIVIVIVLILFLIFTHKSSKESLVVYYPFSYASTSQGNITNLDKNVMRNLNSSPTGNLYVDGMEDVAMRGLTAVKRDHIDNPEDVALYPVP